MKIRVMILLAALCMVITSTKAANDKETKKQYEKALAVVLQEYNKQFAKVAKDSVISIRLFVEGNNVVYQTKCDEDDVNISDLESDSLKLKKILLNESLSDVLINTDKGLIIRFIGNKSGKIANIHITPQEVIEFKERKKK